MSYRHHVISSNSRSSFIDRPTGTQPNSTASSSCSLLQAKLWWKSFAYVIFCTPTAWVIAIFISALWKRDLSLEPLTNCSLAHWVTSLRYRAWDGNIILDYVNGSEAKNILKRGREGDFPGSLVAKTSASSAGGASSIPAKELKPHTWPKTRTWNSGNVVTNSVKTSIFKGRIQDGT